MLGCTLLCSGSWLGASVRTPQDLSALRVPDCGDEGDYRQGGLWRPVPRPVGGPAAAGHIHDRAPGYLQQPVYLPEEGQRRQGALRINSLPPKCFRAATLSTPLRLRLVSLPSLLQAQRIKVRGLAYCSALVTCPPGLLQHKVHTGCACATTAMLPAGSDVLSSSPSVGRYHTCSSKAVGLCNTCNGLSSMCARAQPLPLMQVAAAVLTMGSLGARQFPKVYKPCNGVVTPHVCTLNRCRSGRRRRRG